MITTKIFESSQDLWAAMLDDENLNEQNIVSINGHPLFWLCIEADAVCSYQIPSGIFINEVEEMPGFIDPPFTVLFDI